jgi:Flp pilus assembly protein TadG
VANGAGGTRRARNLFNRALDASGQSLAELAIVLPVLLLMSIGVADLGRIFYLTIELTSAARAGVQYGSQNPATAMDSAGMIKAAQTDANDVVGTWWGTGTKFAATAPRWCQCQDGSPSSGAAGACSVRQYTFVEVNTSADFLPFSSFVGLPTMTVRGKAIMRVLND